jgi:transcriptional regulator with XRE-family HTH domain
MPPVLAPTVRAQFAQRLRALRAQRGFERARHFAKALGIEENRYTRYERAEVEPNLTLIYEICQKLSVTPNELLGFAEPAGEDATAVRVRPAAESAAAPAAESAAAEAAAGARSSGQLSALAWQLASEAAHGKAALGDTAAAAADPLRLVRETGQIYSRLEGDPFGTVADIVNDPALKDLGPERKIKLAALIEAYTEGRSA